MSTYCSRVFHRRRVAAKHMLPDTGPWRSGGTGPRGRPPGASRIDLEQHRYLPLRRHLLENHSETICSDLAIKAKTTIIKL